MIFMLIVFCLVSHNYLHKEHAIVQVVTNFVQRFPELTQISIVSMYRPIKFEEKNSGPSEVLVQSPHNVSSFLGSKSRIIHPSSLQSNVVSKLFDKKHFISSKIYQPCLICLSPYFITTKNVLSRSNSLCSYRAFTCKYSIFGNL